MILLLLGLLPCAHEVWEAYSMGVPVGVLSDQFTAVLPGCVNEVPDRKLRQLSCKTRLR
jgi:hypothetical protein